MCVVGSYSDVPGASVCIPCGDGATTSASGQTSCDSTCSNIANVTSWTIPSWISETNTVSDLCTISACDSAYQVKDNSCSLCIIDFDANGGTGTTTSVSCACNSACNLPANGFSRGLYKFLGWATTYDGLQEYGDQCSVTPTGDITLYAKWYAYAPTLHVGDQEILLSPTKQTSPAIGIRRADGNTYWGNISSSASGSVNIGTVNGQYWLVNDVPPQVPSCAIE